MTQPPLTIADLRRRYDAGALIPSELVAEVLRRIAMQGDDKVWISRFSAEELEAEAKRLEALRSAEGAAAMSLYGIPFAVKDNIDVAGLPTTAGCPDFAYRPDRSATVVERLRAAGAIVIGKTNLDQFATGLVGVRSPYGVPRNPFDPAVIPGGSSSGSAVAVAAGLVAFSLGTDTAGSGRVPAGLNNIVGLKPTKGLVSTRGVVPACRSLDCVSLFAHSVADADAVLEVAAGFDEADPYSRPAAPSLPEVPATFRFAVPCAPEFFGDDEQARLFDEAVARLSALGGIRIEIDDAPLAEAAALLYGPFVAERTADLGAFVAAHPGSVHPVTRTIIEQGNGVAGTDVIAAFHRLQALRRAAEPTWREADVLVVPTAPTVYRVAEVEADSIRLNTRLGRYTNFVNLLDLAALAVPAGFRSDGVPAGITLIAPAWGDRRLARLGRRFLGEPAAQTPGSGTMVPLAVCGAHLSGEPLNGELVARGARLVRACRTAPEYRLFALADGRRPGLVRHGPGHHAIEVEVWDVPAPTLGAFVAGIAAPLGIGTVALEDGTSVKGFLCEPHGLADAEDISAFGGWRAWRRR